MLTQFILEQYQYYSFKNKRNHFRTFLLVFVGMFLAISYHMQTLLNKI